MRVLITGNKGYIGSVMSEYLSRNGHSVFGVDVNYFDNCFFGSPSLKFIRTQNKDVRDISKNDLVGLDAIIYLSALSNDPLGEVSKESTYDINWIAAVRVAMLARESGVKRFLFASSCSMYGAGDGDSLLDEETPQKPITTYAESKVWAERSISNLANDRFSPIFFRCGTAYGVSPQHRLDLVLNAMVAGAYLNKIINVYNGGSAWRPIVHIEDISQAFNLGLISSRDKIHNQAFNVGETKENYQVKDLAEIVKDSIPSASIEVSNVGVDSRSYKVSFEKIKKVLGFAPKWSAKSGVLQLLNAYRDNKLETIDVDRFYIRLNRIRELISNDVLDEDLRWK